MSEECAIVIPIYKDEMAWNEVISLQQCKDVFNSREILFVCPEGLNVASYKNIIPRAKFVFLKPYFFKSIENYSLLLSSSTFYKHFLQFKYILIYQLDAFVFEDQLDAWCSKEYDYVGAPWIESQWIYKLKQKYSWIEKCFYPVGNGGLSLRKVKTFYYNAIFFKPFAYIFWKQKWNEDFYWAFIGKMFIPGYKVPSIDEALKFAFEENPTKAYKRLNNTLPFGCHAWEKYEPEFWQKHIQSIGYSW